MRSVHRSFPETPRSSRQEWAPSCCLMSPEDAVATVTVIHPGITGWGAVETASGREEVREGSFFIVSSFGFPISAFVTTGESWREVACPHQ